MVDRMSSLPEFARDLEGHLLVDEPMSKHTSWRTGGTAEYFYTPSNRDDLVRLLKRLPGHMQVHWVGLGSNLLVRDGGLSGMVIRTSKGLDQISVIQDEMVYAESGVSCARVARVASRNYLTGVEFLSGVPGSFGGALAMNAGAFGGETWDWVDSIDCVDRKGNICTIDAKDVSYGYRHVDLPPDSWILSGVVALEAAGENFHGRDKIKSLLEKRASSQPVQSANAGSVFRNPEGDFAARLIEEAGLKGKSCGDAVVSDVHANFIVNRGKATSADIEELIVQIRESVKQKSGITLDLEVRIMGER